MQPKNEVLQRGRYRIIHRFEQDGTGAFYEAYDNVLKTNVTLKEISVKLQKVADAQKETPHLAFISEAKILREIKHEAFLHVHDYFSEIDRHYLVMESVTGNSLGELIEKNKRPFVLSEVANWAEQLLNALTYLHTRMPPVIYRDLKPQNVKLTWGGKIKLAAPGVAKSSPAETDAGDENQVSGGSTLHYSPLEQIWDGLDQASQNTITNGYDEKSEELLRRPADARSDIYAVGATLYHLATARLPVGALERSIDILEGKPDPLPSPNELNPTIPPEVSDVFMKALQIKRENRFESASMMRQVLRTAFVRVKEREAAEANGQAEAKKQEEAAREVRLAEEAIAEETRLNQERQLAEQERAQQERLEKEKLEREKLEREESQREELEREKLEQERQIAEQEQLEIEAEQNRQMELDRQRSEEAEAQRLKAEQQAAEAEKLLLEKETAETEKLLFEEEPEKETPEIEKGTAEETKQLDDTEPLPAVVESVEATVVETAEVSDIAEISEDSVQVSSLADTAPEKSRRAIAERPVGKQEDLAAAPPTENKSSWRMPVMALIVLVLGGAVFGIWALLGSKPAESNQTTTNQTIPSGDKPTPAPTVETPVQQNVVTTPETSTAAIPSSSPNPAETSANAPAPKNKSLAPTPAPQAKKQPSPTPKTPANQKKAVTVDDIINDN